MACLSETNDPCEVIKHVHKYRNLYSKLIKSPHLSRDAFCNHKNYSLFFTNPVSKSTIILNEKRILQIIKNPNCLMWCSDEEKCVGFALLNSSFFRRVLLSFDEALKFKNERKRFCMTFKIPTELFPNIAEEDRCPTLFGEKLIQIMQNCC